MKTITRSIKLWLLIMLVFGSNLYGQNIATALVDPLEKVFPESVIPYDTFLEIDVAKGETAATQLVLRSDQDINNIQLTIHIEGEQSTTLKAYSGLIGYVRAERAYTDQAVDRLTSNTGFYPDPILDDKPIAIKKGVTNAVYISVPVPKNAKPGNYTVKVEVSGGQRTIEKSFKLKVHNVTLDQQSLWVTNWYSLSAEKLKLLNNGKKVVLYSDTYWSLLQVLAEKMAAYGQNVALISPLDLATYKKQKDKLEIDFSHFDTTVEIFKKAGVVGRIEGGHIGQRGGDWASQFIVRVPQLTKDSTSFKKMDINEPEAKAFYKQFFTELKAHLMQKGWWDIYYQHIADEPTGDNKETYVSIASYVKSIVPEIKIMEACHSKDLAETIDLWVPQLDFLNKDFKFYQERKQAGDEAWFYTCLSPRGNYANRFIDLPLIKTRLLHWINYKYNIKGYLHWGFNYWNDDPFGETTGINSEGGNVLPTGDSWIVYPGYHKLYSSIRLESMRDGINDYTLLEMLEKKNPELAKHIIDNMVFRFDWYDTSIKHFRKARKEILSALAN